MRGRAVLGALLLSLAAPRSHAGPRPYWNAQYGQPQGASLGAGLLLGHVSGEHFQIASHAALVELRPGTGGGALLVGWVPLALKSRAFAFGGVALKGALLRTWGTPGAGLPADATYAGGELHLAWIVKGSIGVVWRVGGAAGSASAVTWSVGLGL